MPRSDACTACFQRYCYDPLNPPSKADLPPGRKFAFVDPDPQGLARIDGFFERNKFSLIGGLVALVVLIGLMVAGLLWRKKRLHGQQQTYKRVSEFHDDDAPWTRYSDHARGAEVYELPNHRGGL